MGSKADFYVGRGTDAEWIGSIAWDGLPAAMPPTLVGALDEDTYRKEVDDLLSKRGDALKAEDGWPWPWDTSHGTKYAYAFDGGRVWTCCYGSSWWQATHPEPDHTSLKRKAARFPSMALVKKGGGVLVIEDE